MKSYFISVVAIGLMSVLLQLLLSEGKTKKYIQGIINIALIVMIISPLLSFIEKKPSFNTDTNIQYNSIDNNFVNNLTSKQIELAKDACKKELAQEGYPDAEMEINVLGSQWENKKLNFINVTLSNLGINNSDKNIDRTVKIKKIVKKYFNAEDSQIFIYE